MALGGTCFVLRPTCAISETVGVGWRMAAWCASNGSQVERRSGESVHDSAKRREGGDHRGSGGIGSSRALKHFLIFKGR